DRQYFEAPSSTVTANILPAILKTRSFPHCTFSVACGKERQWARADSISIPASQNALTAQINVESSTRRWVRIKKRREFSQAKHKNTQRLKTCHGILFSRARAVGTMQGRNLLTDHRIVGRFINIDLRPVRVI